MSLVELAGGYGVLLLIDVVCFAMWWAERK